MKIELTNQLKTTTVQKNVDIINPLEIKQGGVKLEKLITFEDVVYFFNSSPIINNQTIPTEINIKIKSITAWDNFLLNANKNLIQLTHKNINKPSFLYDYLSKHNFWFINKPLIENVFHPVSSQTLQGKIQFNIENNENKYPKHDLYKLINKIGLNNALNLSLLHELGHIVNAFTETPQNQLFMHAYLDKNTNPKTSRNNPFFKNYSETFSDLYAIFTLNLIDKNDITPILNELKTLRKDNLSIQYNNSFILEKLESIGINQYKNINSFNELNTMINKLCLENIYNTIKEQSHQSEYQDNIKELKDKFLNAEMTLKDKREAWLNSIQSNNTHQKKLK